MEHAARAREPWIDEDGEGAWLMWLPTVRGGQNALLGRCEREEKGGVAIQVFDGQGHDERPSR